MVKITQFERIVRSVPTGTGLLKGKVNIGDSPYRCMIWAHQSAPHLKAMLMVVTDLRSGHRNTKITCLAYISKHGRRETKGNCPCTNLEGSHESQSESMGISYCAVRKSKPGLIWVLDPFNTNLNLIWRPKWVWKLNKRLVLILIQIRRPRLSPIIK
jgi:hypothetical protein